MTRRVHEEMVLALPIIEDEIADQMKANENAILREMEKKDGPDLERIRELSVERRLIKKQRSRFREMGTVRPPHKFHAQET